MALSSNELGSRMALYGLHANVPDYMVKGGVTYRLVTNQVGSVRLVVDSNGNVAEGIDYDEFGNVLADSAPGFQPFGFAGGLRDMDTALTKFGARDYDPVTGRWTTKDPEGLEGGLNVYEYAANDPINHIDPSGDDWLNGDLSWLQKIGDAANGFADTITGVPFTDFSLSGATRDLVGAASGWDAAGAVNKCSDAYTGGKWAGRAWNTVFYSAVGGKLLAKIGSTRWGHMLNHNRYLRFGPGRWGREMVDRLSIGNGPPSWWNHWRL